MPDVVGSYRNIMAQRWPNWWVNWPLTRVVAVGDIFVATSGRLVRAGDMTAGLSVRAGTSIPSFEHDSNGSVEITFAPAAGVADARMQAEIRFRRGDAMLVAYDGVTQADVADATEVATTLLRRWWAGGWDLDKVVVTSVTTASGGILLSGASESGGSVRLNARAGVGSGPFTVVDLAMKFDLDRSTARNDSWTVEACTPMFQVTRLKRTFLRRVVEDFGMSQGGLGAFPTDVPPALINYVGEHPEHVIDVVPPGEAQPGSGDVGAGAPSVA
ncbi:MULTISPECIES: hypothetical protein [unclassified Frankia]|uniref:hypothetical protein n=1 Tax=unclassified Frankia TaxID=2632575 RepID=UPI002AD42104|nr:MULTISPECIES: hypothetical protein [unclassified Frankia]